MNESELIRLCLEKDKAAWDLFVRKYAKVVNWAVRKRLSIHNLRTNDQDISDLIQEVFLVIVQGGKLSELKDPKMIPGWLAMIASNKTIDFIRRRAKTDRILPLEEAATQDTSMNRQVYSRELHTIVNEAVESLSAREKLIVSLNLFEQKRHKEIAWMLKIPVNTVSTVIKRAKEKLRKRLETKGIKDF